MGATGLGTALNELPVVRAALAVVGGLVLVIFGVRMMFGALGGADDGAVASAAPARLVRWSFLTLLTNPKALSLYVVVVPGLAAPTLSGFPLFVVFATVHITLLAIWLFLVDYSATRVPGIARSARTRRFILGFAGLVMAALGVATAVRGFA